MNFSVCLLGVISLALLDICLAFVAIKYEVRNEIEEVYRERKKEDRHLGHLATLTKKDREEACISRRPGEYDMEHEESRPHMHVVDLTAFTIKSKETGKKGGEEGPSKSEKVESPKKDKEPMEGEDTPEKLQLELEKMNMKEIEVAQPEQPTEVRQIEPDMIYDEDVAFRCVPKDPKEEPFIISYGFAKRMFFISIPIGKLDFSGNVRLSGRRMQLQAYMFEPPVLHELRDEKLHQKYYDLRQRTEKARGESLALMLDIEKNDDISALMFQEKNILCAAVLDTDYYKQKGFKFVAAKDAEEYKYEKVPVGFEYPDMKDTFPTDVMKCKVETERSPDMLYVGLSRSYNEGGDLFSMTLDKDAEKQHIDAEFVQVPVLLNRKYAGTREGVLEVLNVIRGVSGQ